MSLSKAFKITSVFTKYPIMKGMASYALIWPVSSIIHQTMEGKTFETYDWNRCLRFCLYGSLFTAPTLYGWVKLSSSIWPHSNLRTAVIKALIEQVTYGPFALASFFFGMSLMETRNVDEAVKEVKAKFLPTYKVGVCVWPVLQTINFSLISESNRVPFVSLCSLMWTSFLAYMKYRNAPVESSGKQHSMGHQTPTLLNQPSLS
uniref:Uncharacterized protein n=1 Tax=Xenopsylla cheopis TaxID=163159 RepID=A0A6M2DEX2_XENCH